MSLGELALALAYPAVLFVVAFLVERRLRGVEPLFSVPELVRTLVGGAALGGPWVLYWSESFRTLGEPVDLFATLTLSMVLWLGATRLVGVGVAGEGASTC